MFPSLSALHIKSACRTSLLSDVFGTRVRLTLYLVLFVISEHLLGLVVQQMLWSFFKKENLSTPAVSQLLTITLKDESHIKHELEVLQKNKTKKLRMASTSKSCSILFSIQLQYGHFFFRFLGINYRIWSIWLGSGFKAGHFARESCQTCEKCSWRLTKNRWRDQGFLWLYPQHGAQKKGGGKETGMSSFIGRFSIIALLSSVSKIRIWPHGYHIQMLPKTGDINKTLWVGEKATWWRKKEMKTLHLGLNFSWRLPQAGFHFIHK